MVEDPEMTSSQWSLELIYVERAADQSSSQRIFKNLDNLKRDKVENPWNAGEMNPWMASSSDGDSGISEYSIV